MPASYSLTRSSGMPQPISAPTMPPVAAPAPAPAMAAASGPAITRPSPGNAIVVPTAAMAAAIAPRLPPIAPPIPAPSAAFEPSSVSRPAAALVK